MRRDLVVGALSTLVVACASELPRGRSDGGSRSIDGGSPIDAGAPQTVDASPPADGTVGPGDSGGELADGGPISSPDAGVGPTDPCPDLPIPATCFGRSVVYRDWGPEAVGDGTVFASQAPWRLGFNRRTATIWIVKFQTESDSYRGRVSAGADASGGALWVSDTPCDAGFAIDRSLVGWGPHGTATVDFLVARNDEDAARMAIDFPPEPQLRGGHCYYAVYENVGELTTGSFDEAFLEDPTAIDGCGTGPEGDGTCFYLGIDMGHRLHTFDGTTFAGNVIPGYTIGP
jgi:hypothetical protein